MKRGGNDRRLGRLRADGAELMPCRDRDWRDRPDWYAIIFVLAVVLVLVGVVRRFLEIFG